MKTSFLNIQKIASASTFAVLMLGNLTSLPAISSENNDNYTITATGYLTPESYVKNMALGQTLSLERSITVQVEDIIQTNNVAPEKLDILFLADNTDSMEAAIQNVQDNAQTLLNSLSTTYNNVQFGVARYYGDPQEKTYSQEDTGVQADFSKTFTFLSGPHDCVSGQGDPYTCYKYQVDYQEGDTQKSWTTNVDQSRYEQYGSSYTNSWTGTIKQTIVGELGAENAYELQTAMTANSDDAIAAINNWGTSAGGDWSEGNFFGLHQAATNGSAIDEYATGYNTNWRDDAKKIIVWFGDAQSHTNTVSQAQVMQALNEQDISVIAIHTRSTDKSETHGLDANSQASTIAASSKGEYASVYSSELADTMVNLIGTTAVQNTISPAINLSFDTQGDIEGLNVTYTCIDQLGCENVTDGETRRFQMDITADATGSYTFKTIENTTGALADNTIKVSYPD